MATAKSGGSASDAKAATREPGGAQREARQEYLDRLADERKEAVKSVKQMIDDLKASLTDHEAEAKEAEDAAQKHREG